MKYIIYQGNPRTNKQAKKIHTADDLQIALEIQARLTNEPKNKGKEFFVRDVPELEDMELKSFDPLQDFAHARPQKKGDGKYAHTR